MKKGKSRDYRTANEKEEGADNDKEWRGGEWRSGRQSANQRRRASHTPFPLLLAQDKRITDAMALTACDLP